MEKMTRLIWPQEYSELERINELLLCGICYEYMDTAVMAPCSHNYCSVCIRKYLHYSAQCPICFHKTFEKDLHTNRILDDVISYFRVIKEKLVDRITGAKIDASQGNESIKDSPQVTPVRPARINQNQKKTPLSKVDTESSGVSIDSPYTAEKIASLATASPKVLSSPSTSGTSKVATFFTPKSKKNAAAGSSRKTVPCPVCKVDISEIYVNKHLDDCLKRETASQQRPRIEPKRKPMPKLVFSLMKDAQLRKVLKELGLPALGDKKTLESRYLRYSILYNAECDKKEPRSVEQLLKQCEDDENIEKKMFKIADAANRLKVTRGSEHNVIEEAQKKYLKTNKQNYDSLIASIKNRGATKKLSVRRSLINEKEKSVANESTEQVAENNIECVVAADYYDGVSYSMNDYDAVFHDSDSNSSCPLQHYTSDDPINFLSIQMTDSNGNSPTANASMSNSLKMRRSGDDLPNSPLNSPAKNIEPNVLPSEISSGDATRDIFNVTTENKSTCEYESSHSTEDLFNATSENESTCDYIVSREMEELFNATTESEDTDEDLESPSPIVATRLSTKRPKLSLRQVQEAINEKLKLKFDQNKSEGQKLALSIAKDFTFDSSSNDSVESGAVHETADIKTTEMLSAETHKSDSTIAGISNRDKENHKSSTPSSNAVRPVRNYVTRARNKALIESKKLKETPITTPEEAVRADVHVDKRAENPAHIDSPLKRRRGRKSAVETEPKCPPRKPLRKRNSFAVSEKAKER